MGEEIREKGAIYRKQRIEKIIINREGWKERKR